MVPIKLWILISLIFITACQKVDSVNKPICVIDFTVNPNWSRLNDEYDHSKWVGVKNDIKNDNDAVFEFHENELRSLYKHIKEQSSALVRDPSGFIDEEQYLNQINQVLYTNNDNILIRAYPFQSLGNISLEKWVRFASGNGCQSVAYLNVHWIQYPIFEFLKKTKYKLGLYLSIDYANTVDGKARKINHIILTDYIIPSRQLNESLLQFTKAASYQKVIGNSYTDLREEILTIINN